MVESSKLFVIGNWKMHLSQDDASKLASAVCARNSSPSVIVGLCPSFVTISTVLDVVGVNGGILVGAQDCYALDEGAYTGNVSAPMLMDAGCDFTLVGHSERRTHQHETSHMVREKAEAALRAGLHAVLCVGEPEEFRQHGNYLSYVETQLRESLPLNATRETLTVAYEPLWAIGTGKTAGKTDIEEMHDHLKAVLSEILKGEIPRVIYGGSVKANNALDIMSLPVVDGVLVGGASLDASAFNSIIDAAHLITSNQSPERRAH